MRFVEVLGYGKRAARWRSAGQHRKPGHWDGRVNGSMRAGCKRAQRRAECGCAAAKSGRKEGSGSERRKEDVEQEREREDAGRETAGDLVGEDAQN